MKAARLFPLLLAGATLILLGANVVPASQRKHRLREELGRLARELAEENAQARRLKLEISALRGDAFYLERLLVETWRATPDGALPFDPYAGDDDGQPVD